MKRTWVSRHRQGVNLSQQQGEAQYDYLEDSDLFVDQAGLLPGMAAKRRDTFALFYDHYFGSPPRDKWTACVSYIAQLLKVAPGRRDTIVRDVVRSQLQGTSAHGAVDRPTNATSDIEKNDRLGSEKNHRSAEKNLNLEDLHRISSCINTQFYCQDQVLECILDSERLQADDYHNTSFLPVRQKCRL
jgi:hypothetical protein